MFQHYESPYLQGELGEKFSFQKYPKLYFCDFPQNLGPRFDYEIMMTQLRNRKNTAIVRFKVNLACFYDKERGKQQGRMY